MKYYGYKNTKINRVMGIIDGGEWVRVMILHYWALKLFGYIVKKER